MLAYDEMFLLSNARSFITSNMSMQILGMPFKIYAPYLIGLEMLETASEMIMQPECRVFLIAS